MLRNAGVGGRPREGMDERRLDSRRKARPHVEGSFKKAFVRRAEGKERIGEESGRAEVFQPFAAFALPKPPATAPAHGQKSLINPVDCTSLPTRSYLILRCYGYGTGLYAVHPSDLAYRTGLVTGEEWTWFLSAPMRVEHLQPTRVCAPCALPLGLSCKTSFAALSLRRPQVGEFSVPIDTVRCRKST